MVEIKALECPNCGAIVIDATKPCRFCSSKIILADDKAKFSIAGRICQRCGEENPNRNRFCKNCGINFFIECPKCNNNIDSKSIHCSNCGININEEIDKKCQEEEIRRQEEETRRQEEEIRRQKEEEENRIKIENEERKRIEIDNRNKKITSIIVWFIALISIILIIGVFYNLILVPQKQKPNNIEQDKEKIRIAENRLKDSENSKDDYLWNEAKKIDSINSYKDYINSSKIGKYKSDAESKILKITNRISSLSSIKNLEWKIILDLRAKTFYGNEFNPVLKRNAWEDKGPSEWMTDAWIGVNHCDEWNENLNVYEKGQIINKAKNEIKNVIKNNIITRVKFSQLMVLSGYDFDKKYFTLSLCGSESELYRNISIDNYINAAVLRYRDIQQPVKKCSELMKANGDNEYPSLAFKKPYDDLIYFHSTIEDSKSIIETLSSDAKVCSFSYSQKVRNNVIGSVFVDYVADISSNYSGGQRFGALDAQIVGAYIWKDSTRKILLGTTGMATKESAYK